MGRFGVLPYTPVALDFFATRQARCFFLSHFHADHYAGLSDGFNGGPIYCTEITKRLLHHKFKLADSCVIALDYGSHTIPMLPLPHQTAQAATLDENGDDDDIFANLSPDIPSMTVTLFPANHCPGACMILFEGYFGKYFCTGDMRYDSEMHDETLFPAVLRPDRLFLDTTFAETHWDFPKKRDSIESIVSFVERHLKSNPNARVFLECSMLGTEEILLAIFQRFKQPIHVDEDKYHKLTQIPEMDALLTTDATLTRFHACRAGALAALVATPTGVTTVRKSSSSTSSFAGGKYFGARAVERLILDSLRSIEKEHNHLYLKPSSQWFGQITDERMRHRLTDMRTLPPQLVAGVWHFLFSIHSSHSELLEFIKKVQPKRLTAMVDCSDAALKILTKSIPAPAASHAKMVIPESIQKVLNSKNNIYQASKINQAGVIQRKRPAEAEPADAATPKRAKLVENDPISLEESPVKLWTLFEGAQPLSPNSRADDDDEIQIEEEDDEDHEKDKENSPFSKRDELEKLNSDAAIDALERFSQDQCGVASGSVDALLELSQKQHQHQHTAEVPQRETQPIDLDNDEEDGNDIVNMSVYKDSKLAKAKSTGSIASSSSSSLLLMAATKRNSTPLKLFYDDDDNDIDQ